MNSAIAGANLERARALAAGCRLCPRACGARRDRGEAGRCGVGSVPGIFMEYVHWGEDENIVPAQTLYLAGCSLSCVFCQSADEMARLPVADLTPEVFSAILARGREAGARTVNILGGEPTVNLPGLLEVFARVGDFPGLVWNTNLYGSAEAFGLLDGVVDIYMADIKFGNAECGARLAGAADAAAVERQRAAEIFARSPDALIVRHLVMPEHYSCCTVPTLEWIARNLSGVRVSLKTVFMPPAGMPPGPERRFLTADEVARARALAESLGLRLTRDAVFPESGDTGPNAGAGGGNAFMEVVVTPEGGVYVRHVVRQLSDAVRAAAAHGDNG